MNTRFYLDSSRFPCRVNVKDPLTPEDCVKLLNNFLDEIERLKDAYARQQAYYIEHSRSQIDVIEAWKHEAANIHCTWTKGTYEQSREIMQEFVDDYIQAGK